MKKLIILALLILTAAAFAVPQYLTYQGILRDSSGALVTGTKSMAFGIFNASTGGSAVFSSGTLSVSVSNGNYTVQLGPVNSTTIFNDTADKYLEVSMDSLPLSPRLKINSVGYAIRAGVATSADTATTATTATTVSDLAITTGKINDLAVTGAKMADNTITGGKILSSTDVTVHKLTVTQIATTGAGCVGKGTIIAGNNYSDAIPNTSVTQNTSSIIISPRTMGSGLTYEALVPRNIIDNTSFRVGFSNSNGAYTLPVNIDFDYLIIN